VESVGGGGAGHFRVLSPNISPASACFESTVIKYANQNDTATYTATYTSLAV